jgi:AcrR family transcriptional regulator
MGRPRLHDERTRLALLDTAERLVESDGADALTVRGVAEAAGTTTRAVYSLFGSKDELVIALGNRAFDFLGREVRAVPVTDDPGGDLVEAGVTVFRRLVVEHPALYRIGIQRTLPMPGLTAGIRAAADDALVGLTERMERLQAAGGLGDRSVREGVVAFQAMCEGLAVMELRCWWEPGTHEQAWRGALGALVRGFAVPAGRLQAAG